MSDPIDRLEAEARRLLFQSGRGSDSVFMTSLDEDVVEDPAEVERAWQAEIDRRVAEYRTGRVVTASAAEGLDEIRSRLRKAE